MLFNSYQFMLFFPVVTTLYFMLPHRLRWLMLLIASCVFYMSFIPIYILILFLTIIIDYLAGILIENEEGTKRKLYLLLSIITNVLILSFFKYFNFLNDTASGLLSWLGVTNPIPELAIILPIGLSFHTFQAMSYTIEVYLGRQRAERHFGIYALYVMFYPQLVAGPIERPQNLLHQFYTKHDFDYHRITNGLKLMAWGFFKKLVIADRLALLVNTVYSSTHNYQGVSFIVATIFFAFQIYCDFSGYSDIAFGCAQVMGFKFMQNFNRPYLSTSISDFWRRWHISLTTWFKDYVYIPLGGSRTSVSKHYANLFIVFLISGLWHGANWTFVIWGALNGFYLIFGALTKNVRTSLVKASGLTRLPRFYKLIQIVTTFTLVSFSWIFFRAKNVTEALYIIKNLFTGLSPSINELMPGLTTFNFITAILVIVLLMTIERIQGDRDIVELINSKPLITRWIIYYALIISIITLGIFGSTTFIYFQF